MHLFLPLILLLSMPCWAQGQVASPQSVSRGDDEVGQATLELVRSEAAAGLKSLDGAFPGLEIQPFRIVVHTTADSLPPTLRGMHHPGSPGFALLPLHEIRILLGELRTTGARLRPVLVHEMVHELLHQFCGPGAQIPRWFHEGLAQLIAGDTYLGASEDSLIWRANAGQLLALPELEGDFPRDPVSLRLAYAQSLSYVAWLDRRLGRRQLIGLAGSVSAENTLSRALVVATRLPTAVLEAEWLAYLKNTSGAQWRVILQECFGLSMILAIPLLAVAMIRRMRADRLAGKRLEQSDAPESVEADESVPPIELVVDTPPTQPEEPPRPTLP